MHYVTFLWISFACYTVFPTVVAAAGGVFKLATFNTALLPSNVIRQYNARKDALQTELTNSPAEVMCLQEIWRQQDILDVAHAARSQFPYYHSYSAIGTRGQKVPIPPLPACPIVQFATAYAVCLNTSCHTALSQGIAGLVACAFTSCKSHMQSLGQKCLNCMLQASAQDISVIEKQCVFGSTDNYATTHGLLLLSKYPLQNKVTHTYHPNVVVPLTRGYISAEIDGLGPVVCTHLTTEGAFPSYFGPPPFTTFEELQMNETQQILQAYPVKWDGLPPVLLGDFNHGPKTNLLEGEHTVNYQSILAAGYESPYITQVGNCTLCADNPLGGAAGSRKADRVVDHVYVAKGSDVTAAKRIWDNKLAVNTTDGFLPISDHYGVQMSYSSDEASCSRVLKPALLITVAGIILQWLV